MGIKLFLGRTHIQDAAKWYKIGTSQEKWLVDDVAKVGERFTCGVNVVVEAGFIKKGKEIGFTPIGEAEYNFQAKVKYGIPGELIVDCGFPFVLDIRSNSQNSKRTLISKLIRRRRLTIRKGDILQFNGKLLATTFGEQGVYCSLKGTVISRKKLNVKSNTDFDLIIELDEIKGYWKPEWHTMVKPKEILDYNDSIKLHY